MERSSPSRTAGVVLRNVTLNGETYLLSNPDRVRKAAEEEAVVISRRLDMLPAIARACAGLPADQQQGWRKDYLNAMMIGIASPDEWGAYYRSLWRLAFRFWSALDDKHKAGRNLLEGVAWCYELVNADGVLNTELDSLEMAIRITSQEEAGKNLPGSPAGANIPATATPSMEAGQPSTTST